MSKYIDAEKMIAFLEKKKAEHVIGGDYSDGVLDTCDNIIAFIDSLQQGIPDKETILRICKLHKAWSIMAPWENVEDFVTTNWNSKNII